MHPQSGLLLSKEGNTIDLVELLQQISSNTSVDFSNYYTKDEVNIKIENMQNIIMENVRVNMITVKNTVDGNIKNIEILGNTVQSVSDLSDIQSVGTKQEDGRYKMSILSCSKNLFNKESVKLKTSISETTGEEVSSTSVNASDFIKVSVGKTYIRTTGT